MKYDALWPFAAAVSRNASVWPRGVSTTATTGEKWTNEIRSVPRGAAPQVWKLLVRPGHTAAGRKI